MLFISGSSDNLAFSFNLSYTVKLMKLIKICLW